MTPTELQQARWTLLLTQQEMADRLGIARNTIARYEMGHWAIPKMTALAIDFLVRNRQELKTL